MALLTLSLGSNLQPALNIEKALDGLAETFGELRLSSVFESKAVGFDGGNFLNMVVATETNLPLLQVSQLIKDLELRNGRVRGQARFSSRTLDIDILTLGDLCGEHNGIVLPRPEITENAYVLWPLSEICADEVDPHSGRRYADLWSAYDRQRQALWPVDFFWRGQQISRAAV